MKSEMREMARGPLPPHFGQTSPTFPQESARKQAFGSKSLFVALTELGNPDRSGAG